MNSLVQLEDLLSSYPESSIPHFQGALTQQEEFRILASSFTEPVPRPGFYYKHQKFTHRFLSHYDKLLVLSETGTGKSCEVIGFLEMTRRFFDKAEKDYVSIAEEGLSHFKRVYILVRNDTQKKEIRNQIICKCSNSTYITEAVLNAKDEKAQRAAAKRALIAAGYEIITYTGLANLVLGKISTHLEAMYPNFKTLDPEEQEDLQEGVWHDQIFLNNIYEQFDDTIFWFDEAHNLTVETKGGLIPTKKGNLSKNIIYSLVWKLVHEARRTKIILSTATPMINENKELADLLNLLLPVDGKLPYDYDHTIIELPEREDFFPDLDIPLEEFHSLTKAEVAPFFQGQIPPEFDFVTTDLEHLEPYFRGKVNYVRAADIGADVTRQGSKIDFQQMAPDGQDYQSQFIVYPTFMSEFQTESYFRATESASSFRKSEAQASDFVYPDGSWGNGTVEEVSANAFGGARIQKNIRSQGYLKYFDNDLKNDIFTTSLRGRTSRETLENIRRCSSKYAKICENLLVPHSGNFFYYDEEIRGSGLFVLAACLDLLGFERFDPAQTIFTSTRAASSLKPYCGSNEVRPGDRKINIPPKLRYAILTEDTDKTSDIMLELMNSKDNRHGDYIKIVLSSRVGREGININNVREIHLGKSSWNNSNNHQAISRGLRATSFEDIRSEFPNGRVPVSIYIHAALPFSPDYDRVPNPIPEDLYYLPDRYQNKDYDRRVVDIDSALAAERKDIEIRTVMRKLKQTSISCNIHRGRNISPGVDGSPECDYQECVYSCFDRDTGIVESHNFDLLYSGELVEEAMLIIRRFVLEHNRFSFARLASFMESLGYKNFFVASALERFVEERIILLDRMGYQAFLIEDNGYFYLSRSFPNGQKGYELSYYNEGLIAEEPIRLQDIAEEIAKEKGTLEIVELKEMDPYSTEFSTRLHNLPDPSQIELLEEALLAEHLDPAAAPEFTKRLIDYFYPYMIFRFHRPETALKGKREESAGPRGRGRPRTTEERIGNYKDRKIIIDKDTPKVIIHILATFGSSNLTNYDAMTRINKPEGNFRILDTGKTPLAWRNITEPEEKIIYGIMIQEEIAVRNAPFEARGVYGTLAYDKFWIRDPTQDADRASAKSAAKSSTKKTKTDAREIRRGSQFSNWKPYNLLKIYYDLGFEPPDGKSKNLHITKAARELSAKAFGDQDTKHVEFAARWINKIRKEEDEQNFIKFLRRQGRLKEIFPY